MMVMRRWKMNMATLSEDIMHQYMEELSGKNSSVSSKALAEDYESPVEISDNSTLLEAGS